MSDRQRLLGLLRERSFRRGEFTLTSGRTSDFFIDCKPSVLSAEGHALVGREMLAAVRNFGDVVAVAGVELGGCPLASAVALTSASTSAPVDAIYVRKRPKGHGSKKLVEGAGHLAEGAKVVVLEDTATTGGSTLRAVADLREAGFDVVGVVAVVDRLEGAAEAFEEAALPFAPLFTRTDFIPPGS